MKPDTIRRKYRFLKDRNKVSLQSMRRACRYVGVGMMDWWSDEQVERLYRWVMNARKKREEDMRIAKARELYAARDVPVHKYSDDLGGFEI